MEDFEVSRRGRGARLALKGKAKHLLGLVLAQGQLHLRYAGQLHEDSGQGLGARLHDANRVAGGDSLHLLPETRTETLP